MLQADEVDQQILKNCKKVLAEDRLFLDLRTRMYDLFGIYLNNLYVPYFFIYDPFTRNFNYRGLVPELDDINLRYLSELIRKDNRSPIEERICHDLNELSNRLTRLTRLRLPSDIIGLYYIETLGQPFDEDLIQHLYVSKKVFWTKNLKDDFNEEAPDETKTTPIHLVRYIERNVIRIYGRDTEGEMPFIFSPLISDGQYRGNFFIRGNQDSESPGLIISVIQPVLFLTLAIA